MQCEICKEPILDGDYYSFNYPEKRKCFLCYPFVPEDRIFRRLGYFTTGDDFQEFVKNGQKIRRTEIEQSLDGLLILPLTQIVSTYDGTL